MKLLPLPEDKFDCLLPALQARVAEANLQQRTSAETILKTLRATYATRCAGAYVDSFENPRHVLIMTHFPGADVLGLQAFISFLYVAPEVRGNKDNLDDMFAAAANYAKLNGADILMGSSWIYRGAKASDLLWRSAGFEPQETVYVKHL